MVITYYLLLFLAKYIAAQQQQQLKRKEIYKAITRQLAYINNAIN
jgi:hypothetical protein